MENPNRQRPVVRKITRSKRIWCDASCARQRPFLIQIIKMHPQVMEESVFWFVNGTPEAKLTPSNSSLLFVAEKITA